MKRIKIISRLLIISILFLSMQSCFQKKPDALSENDNNETSLFDTLHTAENSLDFEGRYLGTLPCTDCDGVKTEIFVNENKTYKKSVSYMGKSDSLQTEEGKWTIKGSVLNLRNQLNAFQMYFVGENYLQQLDSAGKKIGGESAEKYILKKEISL